MVNLLLAVIYMAFISLGLPDSLLGAAWPAMYGGFGVPLSYAGIVSMIISAGTIVSSLLSDKLTYRFGTGRLTAFSVLLTAFSLFAFSVSGSFWLVCLCAIPYGLGAGSVDASLNNYVALNYASRHMSWLHCMWGVGASLGPVVMAYALTGGQGWSMGYRYIAILQVVLTAILFLSLPLWKKRPGTTENGKGVAPLSLREVLAIPGAKYVLLSFLGYCALEQTCALWVSSYMVLTRGFSQEIGARLSSMFFLGITLGRGINGFLTFKLSDTKLIRLGSLLMGLGIMTLFIPLGWSAIVGLALIGLGCAPVYPCIIHSTPAHFGAERSQAIIGVQMASAYTGTCLVPPVFGLIAGNISAKLLPPFLLMLLLVMVFSYERLLRTVEK